MVANFFRGSNSQLVTTFILGVSGMAFDHREDNFVPGQQRIQLFPKFDILYR